MFKLDSMHGEQGATAPHAQRLAKTVADLQDRMDQLDTWRNESSGMRMRNLVHERLARVHRKLVARLQVVEPHLAAPRGAS
jgi:hypothetical protein